VDRGRPSAPRDVPRRPRGQGRGGGAAGLTEARLRVAAVVGSDRDAYQAVQPVARLRCPSFAARTTSLCDGAAGVVYGFAVVLLLSFSRTAQSRGSFPCAAVRAVRASIEALAHWRTHTRRGVLAHVRHTPAHWRTPRRRLTHRGRAWAAVPSIVGLRACCAYRAASGSTHASDDFSRRRPYLSEGTEVRTSRGAEGTYRRRVREYGGLRVRRERRVGPRRGDGAE
jgi:hypothetical protein